MLPAFVSGICRAINQVTWRLTLPAILIASAYIPMVQADVDAKPLGLKANHDSVCPAFLNMFQHRHNAEAELWVDNQLQPNFAGETLLAATSQQTAPLLHFQGLMNSSEWQWLSWQPVIGISQQFGWDGVASSVVASAVTTDVRWQGRLLLFINSNQNELFYLPDGVVLPTATNAVELAQALKPYQLTSSANAIANVFVYGDSIYQLVKPWGVQQLWPKAQPACELELPAIPEMTAVTTWRETLRQSFVGAVADSLAIEQANAQLNDWLSRPWQLPLLENQCDAANGPCISRTHRVDWLKFYASQDAWSARETSAINELWLLAELQLSGYFHEAFKLNDTDAKAMAERAQAAYFAALTADLTIPETVQDLRFHAELPNYPLDLWATFTADQQSQLVQQKNGFGKTSLMLAAHFNDFDSVKILLAAGANLTAKTMPNENLAIQFTQRDALSYAAENAHPALISLLFSAGANASIRDSQNQPLTSYLTRNPSLQWRQLADKSVVDVMLQGRVPRPAADCPTTRLKMPLLLCTSQGLRIYADELQIRLKKLAPSPLAQLLSKDHIRWQNQMSTQCQQTKPAELLACVKTHYRARIRMLDKLLQTPIAKP
mgnify:FL=1